MATALARLARGNARRVLLLAALAAAPMAAEPAFALPGASEADDPETLVDIPDAALRKAIEEALGKAPGEPVTRGEMATLERLVAPNDGVRQLAGIEYATNLQSLDLHRNDIADLSPLAGLTALTYLHLSDNAIFDVTPLANLTSLWWLGLDDNAIADVSPLAGLTALTQLTLDNNDIADVSPLADMTALTALRLGGNDIADVSPLSGLTSLTYLSLGGNGIADLSPLADMTALTQLYLGGNGISDLSPLAGMTALTHLRLGWNDISDVSPLAGLTALNQLGLYRNDIADLSPLADMTSLTYLGLSNNGIADVTPLAGMTALTGLYLGGNAIADVTPLAGMTALTGLYLGGNAIADVTPLAGLTALTWLWLHSNDIADLSPLAGMTALTRLHLGGNGISDLSPLADMTSLTYLGLSNNGIADVTPLADMTALTELWLYGNDIADLSPLAGMTALTVLWLSSNGISDLSPLADMTALTVLWLSSNGISDLSPLADMTALTELYLGGNGIADVTPLAGMASLTNLDLSNNETSDVSPLSGLTSLTTLKLHGNRIANLGPLSSLASLTRLELHSNQIVDLGPLSGLTSLTTLNLSNNGISDLSPLVGNDGLSDGDAVDLRLNPLSWQSRESHIPTLLQRGVEVESDAPARELPEVPDAELRRAAERAMRRQRVDLATLPSLDASGLGIGDLAGLEGAASLRGLFLDGNRIADIAPLAGLRLSVLTLARNSVEDLAPLADMGTLVSLALDGNSLHGLPPLPPRLEYLYLSDNSLSDIDSLADLRLIELDVSANRIASLAPLAGHNGLEYLHVHDNEVSDLSPLSFESLKELHFRDNAVRDLSPLLDGEKLLMVDARRNPLADDALAVLDALRERRVTVLAGETVPYFPAAGGSRQGFVRVVNRSSEDGHMFVEAVDDAGVRAPRARLEIGARQAVHFNSEDLERGNAAIGLAGIGPPTAGDWHLSVVSALDLEALSYVRTEDGFVAAMHDVLPDAMAQFFNPASNRRQRSVLRVVNTEAEPAKWTAGGYDDRGQWRPMAGSLLVRPRHALTLTARELEDAHGLGDGRGKWRLRTRGFPWFAMSLLESPTGHLANLSTAPDNAAPLADGRTLHRLPLFPAAGGSRQGFARVVNRSCASGTVSIEAVDDGGDRFGPLELALRPRRAAHFNAADLEAGSAARGWGGVGGGRGDWRLELASELDLTVLGYARTADGFVAGVHDLAPVAEDGSHRVVFFNPGSNARQASRLRLINDSGRAAQVSIAGIDDRGNGSGTVTLSVPAGAALALGSAELEAGSERLAGRLGDGAGKWRLRVRSDEPISVMSLLETPSGHLANVSTGTAD